MKLADDYIAVGIAQEDNAQACVVLVSCTGTVIRMPEGMTRKLADDLLRNANYLWPHEEAA